MSVAQSVIGAMTPVIVIFLIGFIAAKLRDFDKVQANALNKLVMNYALPLTLFVGTVEASRSVIVSDVGLFVSFLFIFAGLYLLIYLLCRFLLRLDMALSAITALTATVPGVPFIGPSVLQFFFGADSQIAVSVSSLIINVITVPATIILMTIGTEKKDVKNQSDSTLLRKQIRHAVSAPVVWMPALGLVLVLMGIRVPKIVDNSLGLLAVSTGGVSLFASGIVLASYKLQVNRFVVFTVLVKNIIQPAILWGALVLLGTKTDLLNEAVITTAIPSVSLAVMLAMRFDMEQSDTASSAFFSTILSMLTMGFFVAMLGV